MLSDILPPACDPMSHESRRRAPLCAGIIFNKHKHAEMTFNNIKTHSLLRQPETPLLYSPQAALLAFGGLPLANSLRHQCINPH